ncbi:MAG: hypothetical protein Q7S74_03730 [Nanoarchaeota archaeon]|nr:hypothetical protein [Nanoarchaeota archaeon]
MGSSQILKELFEFRRRIDEIYSGIFGSPDATMTEDEINDLMARDPLGLLEANSEILEISTLKRWLEFEATKEKEYRRNYLVEVIKEKGLADHYEEIMNGAGQCYKAHAIIDTKFASSLFHSSAIHRAGEESVRAFGLRYIERWQMYHDLWKDSKY